MLGATKIMFLRFLKCNCFWFWVLCCEISNYFFCGYNQFNQECYCQLDVFLVSETIKVRLFLRNQDCYCAYFILIVFYQVRFRLRLGCPGGLISLYGLAFHVTPVDLCIIFQYNLYIYISCIMSCANKIVPNYFLGETNTLQKFSLVRCRVIHWVLRRFSLEIQLRSLSKL